MRKIYRKSLIFSGVHPAGFPLKQFRWPTLWSTFTENYGTSPFYSWVNQLFIWPCSSSQIVNVLPKTMLSMELSMVAFLWLVNVVFPIDLRQHPGGISKLAPTKSCQPSQHPFGKVVCQTIIDHPFRNCLYNLFIWDGLLLFNRLDLGVSKNVECLDIWPLIGKAMTSHKMLGHAGPSLNRGSLPEP